MKLNPKKFEVQSIAYIRYIRGMNVENAVVIVDEIQNFSRNESWVLRVWARTSSVSALATSARWTEPLLERAQQRTQQGVKKLNGFKNYAYMVLKGERSCGYINRHRTQLKALIPRPGFMERGFWEGKV